MKMIMILWINSSAFHLISFKEILLSCHCKHAGSCLPDLIWEALLAQILLAPLHKHLGLEHGIAIFFLHRLLQLVMIWVILEIHFWRHLDLVMISGILVSHHSRHLHLLMIWERLLLLQLLLQIIFFKSKIHDKKQAGASSAKLSSSWESYC